MKHYYITAASLILSSCGKPVPVTVDPALASYLNDYELDVGYSTSGIGVIFTSLAPPTIGQCVENSDGSKEIQIDPTYWGNASNDQREQVMFHELGHCSQQLGHTPNYIEGGDMIGCPISIMNPYAFGDLIDCYSENKEYYYEELKSHGN